MASYEFHLDILNFTPYGQTISLNRLDKGDPWAVHLEAYRSLDIGNFMTMVTENAKTCEWSALSGLSPAQPMCGYDMMKKTMYMDPVLQYNAGA